MNLLLFETHELSDAHRLSLSGRRAQHLLQVLRVKSGDRIRVGELDGAKGWAEVEDVSKENVELKLDSASFDSSIGVPPRTELTQPALRFVLALPRPQSFKKILQVSSAMGVSDLIFINSARVEQSFFLSPVLQTESIKEHLLLGLEQAGLTKLPKVEIWKDFAPAKKNIFQTPLGERLSRMLDDSEFRGLPEPGAAQSLLQACRNGNYNPDSRATFLLGPEGGWRDAELEFWQSAGFFIFALGEWVLRTETALTVLLGQLAVMRELAQAGQKS